ncbi:MAG TPA: hypothetical protein VNQ77_04275 [Frankiaceae bacterium]|nr:hypothetical protein [Frankiaceae bacterium]
MTAVRNHETKPAQVRDPLRLCVYTTIALLAWLVGPLVVVAFAAAGFAGYLAARRRGLMESKCLLRDTRLVLGYLGLAAVAGTLGVVLQVMSWLD